MRAVKSSNTGPEMTVRKVLHGAGYRYRLHRKDLPGQPDIVLTGRRSVVFVHGCFWHGHDCKRGSRVPKSNRSYWVSKIKGNTERDERNQIKLKALGWRVLVVWECELKDTIVLKSMLEEFLGPPKQTSNQGHR